MSTNIFEEKRFFGEGGGFPHGKAEIHWLLWGLGDWEKQIHSALSNEIIFT